MTQEDNQERKFYYYLVSGNVVVENDGNVQAIMQNALMTADHPEIGIHQLGKAQQALQVTLFQKMGETINVVDVKILSLTLLGYMSEKQFNHRPEGVKVQERETPTFGGANVIDFTKEMKDRT